MTLPAPSVALEDQLCFALYAASRAVIAHYRPMLDDLGITYPQFLVLMVLWEHDDLPVKDICELDSIEEKFKAFNWYVQSVDGHDVGAIGDAVANAKAQSKQPSVIVLNTIKGKGCKPAEEAEFNHHMMFPDAEANRKEIERMEHVVETLAKEWRAM